MRKIREVILVEGRYDKNTLSQVVDAVILESGGFGIFNDKQKQRLLQKLAATRGLIVMTDADGAGLVIRNFVRSCVPEGVVKHAYIPPVPGKEKRKHNASKEGMLGVEGMRPEVILEALTRAGASFADEPEPTAKGDKITKADMYAIGLSGAPGSRSRRIELMRQLDLPENLSADALLDVLNALMSREEFRQLSSDNPQCKPEPERQ